MEHTAHTCPSPDDKEQVQANGWLPLAFHFTLYDLMSKISKQSLAVYSTRTVQEYKNKLKPSNIILHIRCLLPFRTININHQYLPYFVPVFVGTDFDQVFKPSQIIFGN